MKILKSKLFKLLCILFIVGIVLGIISFLILENEDKLIIRNTLIDYFDLISNNTYVYSNGFINSILSNIKYISFIWIIGIIFILVIIIPLIIIFKGILMGFSIISIIYTFDLLGCLYALILSLGYIINSILIILIGYYSINYAYKCYKAYKYNKEINIKTFIKNYVLIYLIIIILSIISSFIEIYFIFNILKFVV